MIAKLTEQMYMQKREKGSITGEQKVKSPNGRWYDMKKKDTKLNSKVTEKGSIIAIIPDLNFFWGYSSV